MPCRARFRHLFQFRCRPRFRRLFQFLRRAWFQRLFRFRRRARFQRLFRFDRRFRGRFLRGPYHDSRMTYFGLNRHGREELIGEYNDRFHPDRS